MKKFKRYPLLVSMIVSAVLIVASLFILGFFGMRLGTTLAGGSQFEITLNDNANTSSYVSQIKQIVSANGEYVDSTFVEDKFVAGDEEGTLTQRCLVVKVSGTEISDQTKEKIISQIAEKLKIDRSTISDIEVVISSIEGKSVLFVGIAIAIIAVALFVFGWVRYNIFAGLTFIIAILHNIILYLSLLILTRVELGLMSLSVALIMTVLMTTVMIHIFEKFREETKLHISDKLTLQEKMFSCEKQVVKPYLFIVVGLSLLSLLLLFVPVSSVKLTALGIFIAILVSAYTALVVAPAICVNLLEVRDIRRAAVLSRNGEVNKEIQKKIKKGHAKKAIKK